MQGNRGNQFSKEQPEATMSHPQSARSSDRESDSRLEMFESLLDASPIAIFCIDPDGTIQFLNTFACHVFGFARAELLGRPLGLLLAEPFRATGEGRKPSTAKARRKDGSSFPASITLECIDGKTGPRFAVFLRKMTKGDLDQESITAQQRYREPFEQMTDGVFVAEGFGRYLDAKNAGCKMFGYAVEESRTKTLADLLSNDDSSRFSCQLEQLGEGAVIRDERRFQRKDGSSFIGEHEGRQLPDGSYWVCVRDITARKHLEEKLRGLENKFQALVRASSQVVFRMAPDWGEMLELGGSGFIANTESPTNAWVEKYIPLDNRRLVQQAIETSIRQESIFDLVHRVKLKNGAVGWVHSRAVPVVNGAGQITEWFGTAADITERVRGEERLVLAAEMARFGAFDFDPDQGTLSYFSDTLFDLAGWSPDDSVTEERLWNLIHPEDRGRVLKVFNEVIDPAHPASFTTLECRMIRPSGEIRWWRIATKTSLDGEPARPRSVRVIGAVLDITERVLLNKQLEQALLWSDQERQAIIAAAPIAVVTFDSDGHVRSWNPAAETIFGYRAASVIGRIDPTLFPGAHPAFLDAIGISLRGENLRQEVQRIKRDGSVIDVRLSMAPLHGERDGIVCLFEDITAQKKAEADLVRIRAALENARADESRRIARELHDDITQRLSLLSIDLGKTAGDFASSDLAVTLRSYQQKVVEISKALRQVSHQLHPAVMDDLGLERAIEFLCADFSRSEKIPVHFHAQGLPSSIPSSAATCLYRVAQEALHNVSKHARASQVDVKLSASESQLEIALVDSGSGFLVDQVKSGLGLHNMRERLSLMNGVFSIDSIPGEGTRVLASVPLPDFALSATAPAAKPPSS